MFLQNVQGTGICRQVAEEEEEGGIEGGGGGGGGEGASREG